MCKQTRKEKSAIENMKKNVRHSHYSMNTPHVHLTSVHLNLAITNEEFMV